jgi:hypothetical protein
MAVVEENVDVDQTVVDHRLSSSPPAMAHWIIFEGFWYFAASVGQSSYPPPSYPQSRPLSHTAILCKKSIMLVRYARVPVHSSDEINYVFRRVEQATTYFGSNPPITGIPSVDHSTWTSHDCASCHTNTLTKSTKRARSFESPFGAVAPSDGIQSTGEA